MAKRGREVAKVKLAHRFQSAIHRAAMRAGKGGSELYLAEWRRESRTCSGELLEQATREAANLEAQYSCESLDQLVKGKGMRKEAD